MKSVKSRLIVASAVILCVVMGMLIVGVNAENRDMKPDTAASEAVTQDTPQGTAVSETALPDMPQDAAASDAVLPRTKFPVLKIGGKKASDVYLQSLNIEVEVTGNIASTRYTMVFKNEADRILEGELTFPLPDGRSVTYYALDINGRMREAVPVEKAKGTRIFEEIEQRQVDPGLLERIEGNNFRTRIYPIPADGIRTISIGYEEELTLENGLLYYRLPMAYPDTLENFAVKATVLMTQLKPLVPESEDEISFDAAGENYVASFARENYRPSRALIFALPAPADIPQVMTQPAQGSFYFLASVAPKIETRKKLWNDDLAIIWDVSRSGSQRNLRHEIEMLDIIFTEKKNADVHLYFLNNKNVKKGEYKVADGKWEQLKNTLNAAIFDGGTDFSQVNINNIAGNEIIFFSDGLSTLSDADFLKNAKTNRPIHCVVSSAKADYSAMKLIAGKTKGKFVNVNALSSEKLKDELLNETLQFLGIEHGDDVSEVYPSIAAPVHGNFSVAGISKTGTAEVTMLFGFGNTVEKRIKVKLDANAKDAAGRKNVYKIWAQKKIAELDLDYEKNRAELTGLGRQFGIVTRNTSLIVLETAADYVRYDIEPPASDPELQAEYERELKGREEKRLDMERDMLKEAVTAAERIKKWWDSMSKTHKYPTPDDMGKRSGRRAGEVLGTLMRYMAGGVFLGCGGQPPRVFEHASVRDIGYLDSPMPADLNEKMPAITIKPIKKDNEYLGKLTGKAADDYQIYLKIRDDYANSPTYYFDMSEWFYTLGDRETALRVLTSIADLELENASLYRLLGYRFKEYGEYALEKFVCKKVIEWRPMEPQSYRDYAMALADNGESQAALDTLYSLLTRPYSDNIRSRGSGIEEVVVTEINHLIVKNPSLNVSEIDNRLIMKIPVDIRVVINWNMDNTDIDLHVKDPNNEECYFKHRETRIGGRISNDITSGYGPEQFLLKKAVKGKYRIYVNYYGDSQFTSAGPSTIMAEVFTKYADKTERRKIVSLQMSKAKKKGDSKVEVAEFEF